MCFGGDDAPSAPVIAPPPPPKEIRDFFNHVAGVKYITTKDEQGRPCDAVIRLPRNSKEEAFFSDLEEGLQNSIGTIKELTQRAPESLPPLMPFLHTLGTLDQETTQDLNQVAGLQGIEQDVKQFRDISSQYLNERLDVKSRALEDSLAQRGLSQSSQGDKERRELNQQFNKAAIDNDWNALQYGETLATQKLGNRLTGFNARQIGRQSQINTAITGYNVERQDWFDRQGARANQIQEQGNLAHQQNALIQQDLQRAMGANVEANALARHQVDNDIQMQHYNADVDRQYRNYDMQMKQFNANNSAPGPLSSLLNIGAMAAFAPTGTFAGSAAAKLGSMVGLGGAGALASSVGRQQYVPEPGGQVVSTIYPNRTQRHRNM